MFVLVQRRWLTKWGIQLHYKSLLVTDLNINKCQVIYFKWRSRVAIFHTPVFCFRKAYVYIMGIFETRHSRYRTFATGFEKTKWGHVTGLLAFPTVLLLSRTLSAKSSSVFRHVKFVSFVVYGMKLSFKH